MKVCVVSPDHVCLMVKRQPNLFAIISRLMRNYSLSHA